MSPRLREKDGLTFVELAVALAVAAIIAVLAIPTLVGMLPHVALKNGASTLSLLLVRSRMKAIEEMKYFRVSFDLTNDTYQVEEGEVVFDAGSGTNIIQ